MAAAIKVQPKFLFVTSDRSRRPHTQRILSLHSYKVLVPGTKLDSFSSRSLNLRNILNIVPVQFIWETRMDGSGQLLWSRALPPARRLILKCCMESTSYVFSFRLVFFYLVTTGWVFDISSSENSINQ